MAANLDLGTLRIKIGVDNADANKQLDNTGEKIKQTATVGESLKSVGTTILGVTAGIAAGATAVYGYVDKVASVGDEIDKQSQKLGVSAEQYQALSYAADHCGFSVSTFTTAARKLGDTDFDGNIYDAVNALMAIEDPAQRSTAACELFGDKAGREMAALLNGGQDLDDYRQSLEDLGGLMSNDAVANSAAFEDAVTDVKTAFEGASAELLEDFMPIITDVLESVTNFIKGDGDGKSGLQGLVDTVKALTPLIVGATAAFVAYKTATAISSIITALTKATEGQTLAQTLLNAVMNANPFVLIATLIAGVVAAVITLWNTNDGFREAVQKAWDAIKGAVSTAWNAIKNIFTSIANKFNEIKNIGSNLITGLWNGINDKVSWILNKIKGFGQSVLNGIKSIFGIHSPSKETASIGDYLVQGLAKGIEDNTDTAISAVEDLCGNVEDAFNPTLDYAASGYGYGNQNLASVAKSAAGRTSGVATSGVGNSVVQNNYFTSKELTAYEQQVQIKRLERDLVGGMA